MKVTKFDPWVGKIPWRRKWQSTPVFFLGNPMDKRAVHATVHGVTKELDTTYWLNNNKYTCVCVCIHIYMYISSVQFSGSAVSDSLWPHESKHASFTVHHQLLESTQTHVHRVDDAIQLSQPLSSPSPPALNPYQHQGLFKLVSSSNQMPKYWSFSFSISPSKEHPGLISFRMEWLDLLAVQGTLKSHRQHHNSKTSTLQCSAFFTVQLSHPYMTIGKTIALTRWTLFAKECLCFIICYLGWS